MVGMTLTVIAVGVILYVGYLGRGVGRGRLRLACVSTCRAVVLQTVYAGLGLGVASL